MFNIESMESTLFNTEERDFFGYSIESEDFEPTDEESSILEDETLTEGELNVNSIEAFNTAVQMGILLKSAEKYLWTEEKFGDLSQGSHGWKVAAGVIAGLCAPCVIGAGAAVFILTAAVSVTLFSTLAVALAAYYTRDEGEKVDDFIEELTELKEKFKDADTDGQRRSVNKRILSVFKRFKKSYLVMIKKAERDLDRTESNGDSASVSRAKEKVSKMKKFLSDYEHAIDKMDKSVSTESEEFPDEEYDEDYVGDISTDEIDEEDIDEDEVPEEEEVALEEDSTVEKHENIWVRFWNWIKSIFSSIRLGIVNFFKRVGIFMAGDLHKFTKFYEENSKHTKIIENSEETLKIKCPKDYKKYVTDSDARFTKTIAKCKEVAAVLEKGVTTTEKAGVFGTKFGARTIDHADSAKGFDEEADKLSVKHLTSELYGDSSPRAVSTTAKVFFKQYPFATLKGADTVKKMAKESQSLIDSTSKLIKTSVKAANVTDKTIRASIRSIANSLQKGLTTISVGLLWSVSASITLMHIAMRFAKKAIEADTSAVSDKKSADESKKKK